DKWNECPQAQEPVATGLSIVNPEASSESTKSILASDRYGTLIRSITTRTPNCSSATSFSVSWSSRYIAYRRPEHPPGWTATRSAMSERPSSTKSSFTLPAADSLSWIIGPPWETVWVMLGPYILAALGGVLVPGGRFLEVDHLG